MNTNLTQRIQQSPTVTMTTRVAERRAAGADIIGLHAGEPEFDTPEHIKQAAAKAIENNFTHYTVVDGILSLKQAIRQKFSRDNQVNYQSEQILVSCGAKHSIYNAYQALLNPGDEVIISAPYWVSYPDMALLAGANPVIITTSRQQNYKISAAQLKAAITAKTKLLLLCSPANPTGVVYTHAELQALADVLLKHPNIYIISDDIYEQIYWAEQPFRNIVMQESNLYERTIVINGVSKAYAMTGWRIGYAAGPLKIINTMKKLQSQSTGNSTSISQAAAEIALAGPQNCVAKMRDIYHKRHSMGLRQLNDINGFDCNAAQGAFYFFPEVTDAIQRLGLDDDVALSELLLEKAHVATMPGSAFGLKNHLRLSYTVSDSQLKEALNRIKNLLG